MPNERRVLIIGGSFTGLLCGRDLTHNFLCTIVDAKEYFEYTPGILRAFAKPKHFDALNFTLQPVIEHCMHSKFVWGEVKMLDGEGRTADIKPIFADKWETIDFDYCMICAGCNFGVFHPWGESPWFGTIHEEARSAKSSLWPEFDERFIEGRRRHILAENKMLADLEKEKAKVLVVGAGFIGVEWITEIQHYFPKIELTICDFLPQPLGPLPKKASDYCYNYMDRHKIKQFYKVKYTAGDVDFYNKSVGYPEGTKPDKDYICVGVKASNYFMPEETLSVKGPGGGKWILMDMKLGVMTRDKKRWGADAKGLPRIFAIGDCNYGCVEKEGVPPAQFYIPPMPKISYPGEEQALIACCNLEKVDKIAYQNREVDCCGHPTALHDMHWPWGAGMFATSLGPDDACFVAGANWVPNSGFMVTWGWVAAVQKEIIEATITDEASYGLIGRLIWHLVHHTPLHLFGGGPTWGYTW
jgi:hypothetical protein